MWIWYPERRTLSNTVVLFRKTFKVQHLPEAAKGWISADSRYQLFINGHFVQRGPAPCDPRFLERDPFEIKTHLQTGKNVIAVLVLSFGQGEGTYVPGKPGLQVSLELPQGTLTTNPSWKVHRARSYKAGTPKRWYLRALTEEFDARVHPHGWTALDFDDKDWLSANELDVKVDKPPITGSAPTIFDFQASEDTVSLPLREIPMMLEQPISATLLQAGNVDWKVPQEEFFDCYTKDAYSITVTEKPDRVILNATGHETKSNLLTFSLEYEVAGFPFISVNAKAGTVLDILWAECQHPEKILLEQPRLNSRARVICKEGVTKWEALDFEAVKFLQVIASNTDDAVEILDIGVKRRVYPFERNCDFRSSDAVMNDFMKASERTLELVSQETTVDNVVRERQQYEGDGGHTKTALYYAKGEYRLPKRTLTTFAQGQTQDGYFLDCYPAWDRLERTWQRSLGFTEWGPILDHGLGFALRVAEYYLFSGDKETLEYLYPHLLKQDAYLQSIEQKDGLLPVENIGVPSVWIDTTGFESQQDKHASFNLYYGGVLKESLAKIARWLGDETSALNFEARAKKIFAKVYERYWHEESQTLVDNLPRLAGDKTPRRHERTVSSALVLEAFGRKDLEQLATFFGNHPYDMCLGFPGNAPWRFAALGKIGRADLILHDLRTRWAGMESYKQNGVYGEFYQQNANDSGAAWGQCCIAPTIAAYAELLGIKPTEPGFAEVEIRPQFADLQFISGSCTTPKGTITIRAEKTASDMTLDIKPPKDCRATLLLPDTQQPERLEKIEGKVPWTGLERWTLPSGANKIVIAQK
jgi:alpha-L-rhamnosidase